MGMPLLKEQLSSMEVRFPPAKASYHTKTVHEQLNRVSLSQGLLLLKDS